MPQILEIFRLDGKVVDLAKDIEVLSALEEIVSTWEEYRSDIDDLGVADVFELVDRLASDKALFDALTELGIDGERLGEIVATLSATLGRVPEKYRKLIRPIRDFDEQTGGTVGLVAWSLLDIGRQRAGGAQPEYTFELASSASLEFEAGDTWPRGGDHNVPHPLLRLGVAGALQASGSLTLPLNIGAIGLETANTASASLNYYFDADWGDELYVGAVARRLPRLANPFSLESAWQSLVGSDLEGMIARVDGSTSISIEVSIAEGFTLAKELAKAEIGLTVDARLKRTGKYDLVLRALPGADAIEVTLLRRSSGEHGYGIGLGVEINLAGLAGRLRKLLERHHGAFQDVLGKYEDYLTPGTYLRTKFKKALDDRIKHLIDSDDVQAVLSDAFGRALGLSETPAEPELKKLLEEEITEALDAAGIVITGKADSIARDVANLIAERIGLDVSDVVDALKAELENLVTDVQGDLKEKITGLAGPELDELYEALERAGEKVSGAVASADAALAGVREIIGKYENLLTKLIEETGNAARAKIVAKLTLEETRTNGTAIDVRMIVRRNTPATAAAFDALIRGDLDSIIDLLRQSAPGIDFDRENSTLTRFATLNRKLGFEFVLLGFEFGSQSIFDTDAHVTSNGAGRISITSNAKWLKRKESPKENREIQIVDAFELGAASATRTFGIDVNISHEDESLKRQEVVEFLRSFESAALLREGLTDRAARVFDEWAGPGDDAGIKADINLRLELNDKATRSMMKLGDRINANLGEVARREVFRVAIRELLESGAYDVDRIMDLAMAVAEQTRMQDGKHAADVFFDYTRQLHRKTTGDKKLSYSIPSHKRRRRELEAAYRVHKLARGLVEFVDTMGDIYEATPALGSTDGWTESEYIDAQKKLNRTIRDWLRIKSKFLFWIDDEAHPRTVAFVGALMALAATYDEEAAPAGLTVTLVRRDGTDEIVTLV